MHTVLYFLPGVVPDLIAKVTPVLESCKETTAALAELIPPNQFWRWKDMWSVSLRNAVFAAVLVEYLQSGGLLPLPQAAEVLGSTLFGPATASVFNVHLYAPLV